MRYTLLALALVSATLALPTDLSSQKSAAVAQETNFEPDGSGSFPYQRDVQNAQEATVKDFDGPFGPGLPNPFVKRDNQDA
ncbi:hypothetical protein AnigIFM63309_000003 [Aspergillus niger]|nr:hypothetical protein AnigIFM63309_000003 [Aspergillus niger]